MWVVAASLLERLHDETRYLAPQFDQRRVRFVLSWNQHDVDVGRHAKLRRVIVDEGARIPEGMAIGFDAAEDRRRFYVSEGGVTLVTAEMLGQPQRRGR
jgi:ADP-glucose pyrophosphorylase